MNKLYELREAPIILAQLNPTAGDLKGNAKKAIEWIKRAESLGAKTIIFPEKFLLGCVKADFIKKFPIVLNECEEWLEIIKSYSKHVQVITESTDTEDLIIDNTASLSRTGSEQELHSSLSEKAKESGKFLISVNRAGTEECFSFGGASSVYDKEGNLIARAKSFEEEFFVFDFKDKGTKISPTLCGLIKNEFTLNYAPDLNRIYLSLVQSIKDYFKKTGFKRAVLGLSGGLDSTICAVLLADALGKENVFGISMPSKITTTESKNDAETLAQNLGINFAVMPIKEMFETARVCFDEVFGEVQKSWDCRFKESFTNDNIQARSRAMILWGVTNEFRSCLPIATSDKSELYMGYATINGDMSGGFAPIADVTKTKLFALAKWMNENREEKNAIPESIIAKRPGAELAINPKTGKPLLAEEALMPYEFLDEVIWRVENRGESFNEMIDSEFLYEKKETVSKEEKSEWLEKFFRRISTGLYKLTIMPPSPIIDRHSLNRHEYTPLITASKINFKKTSLEEKRKEI